MTCAQTCILAFLLDVLCLYIDAFAARLSTFNIYIVGFINAALTCWQTCNVIRFLYSLRCRKLSRGVRSQQVRERFTFCLVPSDFPSGFKERLCNALFFALGTVIISIRVVVALALFTPDNVEFAAATAQENHIPSRGSTVISPRIDSKTINKNMGRKRRQKFESPCATTLPPNTAKIHTKRRCPVTELVKSKSATLSLVPFPTPKAPTRPLNTHKTIYYSVREERFLRPSPPRPFVLQDHSIWLRPPLPPVPRPTKSYVDKQAPLHSHPTVWMSPEGLGKALVDEHVREIKKAVFYSKTRVEGTLGKRFFTLPTEAEISSHHQELQRQKDECPTALNSPNRFSSLPETPFQTQAQTSTSDSWLNEISSGVDIVFQRQSLSQKRALTSANAWAPPAWMDNITPTANESSSTPMSSTQPRNPSSPCKWNYPALMNSTPLRPSYPMDITPLNTDVQMMPLSTFPSSSSLMDTAPDDSLIPYTSSWGLPARMDAVPSNACGDQLMQELLPVIFPSLPVAMPASPAFWHSHPLPLMEANRVDEAHPSSVLPFTFSQMIPQPSYAVATNQTVHVSGALDTPLVPTRSNTPENPQIVLDLPQQTSFNVATSQMTHVSGQLDMPEVPTQPNTPIMTAKVGTEAEDGEESEDDLDECMAFYETLIEITPPLPSSSTTLKCANFDNIDLLPWLGKDFNGESSSSPNTTPPPGFQFHPAPLSVAELEGGYKLWAQFMVSGIMDNELYHSPMLIVDKASEGYDATKVNEGLLERLFWGFIDVEDLNVALLEDIFTGNRIEGIAVTRFLNKWKLEFMNKLCAWIDNGTL